MPDSNTAIPPDVALWPSNVDPAVIQRDLDMEREGRAADQREADATLASAQSEIAALNARLLAAAHHQCSVHEDTLVAVVDINVDPETASIMDWIVEAVSIDRAHAHYSPLVALADLVAEWVDAATAYQSSRAAMCTGQATSASGSACEQALKTVESLLAMAGPPRGEPLSRRAFRAS